MGRKETVEALRFINSIQNLLVASIIALVVLALGPVSLKHARAQVEDPEEFFVQAKSNPALRASFIKAYIGYEGIPAHVIRVQYSEKMESVLAITNPLVRTENGTYRPTSHALAIGRGYPSAITFGPKMFRAAYGYTDFKSVVQHEAAHAEFWATGKLKHMDRVDTGKNSEVRLRGVLPILFELDAIKTQMDHPSWQQTSVPFRKGQEAYRQKWLIKLERLEQQSYTYDMKPLLDRIRRTYK